MKKAIVIGLMLIFGASIALSSLAVSGKILTSIKRVKKEMTVLSQIQGGADGVQIYSDAMKFFDDEIESFLIGYDNVDKKKVREYIEYLCTIKMGPVFALKYADPDLSHKLVEYSRVKLNKVVQLSEDEAKGLR